MDFKCWSCKKEISVTTVGFREECPHCRVDLHVCTNCTHYDTTRYNECREPIAERVREKDRANRCEFFSVSGGSGDGVDKAKQDLLSQAEALFKKKLN